MKYLVVGKSAILATRNIERIEQDAVPVSVMGAPDGASFYIQPQKAARGSSYFITSQHTSIPIDALQENENYVVRIIWEEQNYETGEKILREADGNSFRVCREGDNLAILPAPLSSACELERMWTGIVDMLEEILPVLDQIKNGNDVI